MRNPFFYCSCALCLLLNACISASYHGKSLPPSRELAVFYSRSEVPKGEYITLGELKVTADTICSSESISKKIREEAMAKGADVAVIYWFDSRFTDAGNHTKECSAHCCCHDHDQYKYKQLVKVSLLKRK